MKIKGLKYLLIFGLCFLSPFSALYPAGTYAEGRKIIRLLKFESGGLFIESWEGEAVTASYTKTKCDRKKYECYPPTSKRFKLSVRTDNARVANYMRKNKNKEMVIFFRRHRFEPAALSTKFEVIDAYTQKKEFPKKFKRRFLKRKTGSRNFSVYGKILSLERSGLGVKTYEGLYLDKQRRKVHPFSITDKAMAKFAYDTMLINKHLYLGISVARVTGFRKSDHDVFEINLDEEAGGVLEK